MTIPETAKKYLVLVGCVMLLMPISIHMTYGNILPYIMSYYQSDISSYSIWVHPLWVITALTITSPIGLAMAGLITRKLHARLVIALGTVLTSLSTLLSFYAIREPLALVMVFGAIQGLGGGLLTALIFPLVLEWMPENEEMAFATTAAGPNFYALIHMFLALYLVNPDNKQTDFTINKSDYFTDSLILENVPYFFLKIGLLTIAIQAIGLALIQFEKGPSETIQENGPTDIQLDSASTDDRADIYGKSESPTTGASNVADYGSNAARIQEMKEPTSQPQEKAESTEVTADDTQPTEEQSTKELGLPVIGDASQSVGLISLQDQPPQETTAFYNDVSPSQALKSSVFWIAWLVYALMGHTYFIHMNLYKEFGLTKVHRDKLLVYSGAVGVMLIIVGRHFSSMLANKFGLKPTLVVMCGVSNLLMTLMPITVEYYSPLYILLVMLEFHAISSIFVFMTILPLILFGSRHYSINLAFLRTSQVAVYILASIITPTLIEYAGWTYVYMCTTLTSAIGIFICLLLPVV